ncbi:hypothetical protein JMJ35_000329 [Cladonia borealis]|uniref:LEA domain protein n=1 Tax=Cladonia borealis TaxID=184061 RepID=A0AA39RAY3_9LECA|nr:hypothetical protein JMJ35_000329 [Cladonia borealis]
MSLRLLTTRVAGPALRTSPSARLFTTTAPFKKSATETAQETIQKANKTAGEAGVAAIEKGQQASAAIKSSVGLNSKEAAGSAKEMAGSTAGSAKEMTGEAKGKAQEVAGEAKGKASELSGAAKGKAEEVKGKL